MKDKHVLEVCIIAIRGNTFNGVCNYGRVYWRILVDFHQHRTNSILGVGYVIVTGGICNAQQHKRH